MYMYMYIFFSDSHYSTPSFDHFCHHGGLKNWAIAGKVANFVTCVWKSCMCRVVSSFIS